jgi:hypothetical protein
MANPRQNRDETDSSKEGRDQGGASLRKLIKQKRRHMTKLLMFKQLGDGFAACTLRNMYSYLWALNEEGHCCAGIRIPDTGKVICANFQSAENIPFPSNSLIPTPIT